jgi:hypothetical protein
MRRSGLLAVVLLTLAVASTHSQPADAQTLVPPVADLIGGDSDKQDDKKPDGNSPCGHGVSFICAGDTIVDAATGVAGNAVSAAGGAVMDGIVSWAAAGASWLVTGIGRQIDRSTRPAIGSAWFGRQYVAVRQLSIALSLLFLLAAITEAVLRQDIQMLARSALVALPLALLLAFVAVTLVEVALSLTDWMTAQSLQGLGGNAHDAFEQLGSRLAPVALTGNPLPGLVLFLSAALTAVLALVVWIELVLREATIYVAVTFLPLAFVAMVWRPTAHWAHRLACWLGALILSKLTIAIAFAIAGNALGHAPEPGGGGLTVLLAGCAVLLVAALTPWVLLRLLPGSSGAADGFHRGSVGQAARTVSGASTATMVARHAIMRSFTPAAAAGAASAGRPKPPPPPSPPRPPQRSPSEPGGPRLDPPSRRGPTPVQ